MNHKNNLQKCVYVCACRARMYSAKKQLNENAYIVCIINRFIILNSKAITLFNYWFERKTKYLRSISKMTQIIIIRKTQPKC